MSKNVCVCTGVCTGVRTGVTTCTWVYVHVSVGKTCVRVMS